MAEGWARYLKADTIEACSAGIEKHGLNQLAVRAMAEAGVDISSNSSKVIADLASQKFDYVITVCDHAHESCPLFSGNAQVIHRGFDDPPLLAADACSDDEALGHYRRVRDKIRDFIMTLPASLN